jgi:hypothetical protein
MHAQVTDAPSAVCSPHRFVLKRTNLDFCVRKRTEGAAREADPRVKKSAEAISQERRVRIEPKERDQQ